MSLQETPSRDQPQAAAAPFPGIAPGIKVAELRTMARRRYGLQRNRQWLRPPAIPIPGPGRVISEPPLTDEPRTAWAAPDIDAANERQQLLSHAFGITTFIRAIPAIPHE